MGAALLTVFDRFYPNNPITNLPIVIAAVLVGSLGLSWFSAALGDYLAESNKQVEETAAGWRLPLVSFGVVAVMVAFFIFFVTTATPPQ
jgi:hypothetical protein